MSVKVKIKDQKGESIQLQMNVRRNLDGSLVISDHIMVDLMVVPYENKIIAIPKEISEEKDSLETMERFFEFAADKGILKRGDMLEGPSPGSLESPYFSEGYEEKDPLTSVLYVIHLFLEDEKGKLDKSIAYEKEIMKHYTDPSDYTDLGDIPHEKKKGSIPDDSMGFTMYSLGSFRII